ncbi:T9SS type A sorting domain-containing protein [Bacteroidota bacterium]
MKLKINIILLLFFTTISYCSAQNFQTLAEVISSGGIEATGGNFSNFSVLGETFVNNSVTGGNYNTSIGFLYGSIITSGLQETHENIIFGIYPNPAIDFLNINSNIQGLDKIEFIDIIGNRASIEEYKEVIDISDLPNGMYLIKIYNISGDPIIIKKIIKVD